MPAVTDFGIPMECGCGSGQRVRRLPHLPGSAPGIRQAQATSESYYTGCASANQDLAVWEQRGHVARALCGHATCRREGSRGRIVQFGAGQSRKVITTAASDQHPTVVKQRGRARQVVMSPAAVKTPGGWALALSATKKIATTVALTLISPSETSLNCYSYFIAGAAEVSQPHRDGGSWSDVARHADIDLVQPGKSRRIPEP